MSPRVLVPLLCVLACASGDDVSVGALTTATVPTAPQDDSDSGGLNPNGGCWTAYCGASDDADATNFGTYHCIDCANCHEPAQGQWQWCNHTSGNWYPQQQGGPCGVSKDLVCKAG